MKVALIGSTGYIADFLLKSFEAQPEIKSVVKIDRDNTADAYLDLVEADKFNYDLLGDVEFVIFTAAISGPDQCAKEYDNCWKVNVAGTSYFIRNAIDRGCKVLFFSSDAVFGNTPGMIYDENSETQACTPYGRMKKTIEDEFKNNPKFKAIRLSYVASVKDRFYTYCLNCARNGEIADIFHPFYRNVITISDVVSVVVYFINHWDKYVPTFLNVAGRELVSRVRMADELNRVIDDKLKYIISIPGEDFFVNRPRITQMKSLYMQQYRIIKDETFTEKIAKELEGIKI